MDDLRRSRVPILALAGIVLTLGAAGAAAPPRAQAEGAEDHAAERALFDGETLAGWDGDPRFWSVEDGAIVGRSTAETPCEATTYLVWTGEPFADFELELEFRILTGNSGVQLRSRVVEGRRWDVVGYQADMERGPSWTGCLYEQGGRGVLVRRGERVEAGPDGSLERTRFADGDALLAAVRPGEWNRYRIVARGSRVELWINGVRTALLVDRDPARARRTGTLALQLHQGPPMEVRYRDLRLRTLPPPEPEPHGEPTLVAFGAGPRPRGIWSRADAGAYEVALFRRRFELAERPVRARLRATCDNALEVFLDGALVLEGEAWWEAYTVELGERLGPGAHVLAVRARNEGGPAALVLALELEYADGRREHLVTDASWRTAAAAADDGWTRLDLDDAGWRPATDLGEHGIPLYGATGERPAGLGPEPEPEPSPEPAEGRAPRWPAGSTPRWIWSREPAGPDDVARLSRTFDVRTGLARATLTATADNRVELALDGEPVAASDAWERPVQLLVTSRLAAGEHVLAARCANEGGPAGFLAVLELDYADGSRDVVVTDEDWRAAEGPAVDLGRLGTDPWGTPGVLAGTVTPGATPAAEIETPPGFTVELLHSVPKEREGSWVSLCADDRGRLYACDQYGGLFRITPAPVGAPASATVVEPLDVALGEAHGLLWAFDALYAVVSGAGSYTSGLWRARDTDGDDRLDAVELLEPFDGSGEHGPHAVLLGPDGASLFVVAGNHTKLPRELDASRVPRVWGEDQLRPRRPDPNGHAVGVTAPGGWVCRTDPDGERWELWAAGMRNAYDAAFDAEGELFTFDSDMEWDVGLPWYRPTRVLHLASGAELGWRHGSGKWPAYWPDSLPAVVDVGLASPTGVVHGRRTGFPPPWDRALLVADWSYGTIYTVHLEPEGASWRGTAEPFVRARPLPVTDLVTAPDGALYFAVGGRRTQSGLYRVRWTGDAAPPVPRPAPAAGELRRAEEARGLRRTLERFHGVRHPGAVAAAWPHLASPDRFVRFAARTAIEHADPAEWAERAFAEPRPLAAVEAGLALVRVAGERRGEAVLANMVGMLEGVNALGVAGDPELEHGILRVAGLCLIRGRVTDRALVERLARVLEARFPGADVGAADATDARLLDRERARLLARLDRPALVGPALERVEGAHEQEEAIFYAELLSRQRSGWTVERRRRYLAWLDDARDALAGGASLAKYLGAMRADALAATPAAERAALEDWLRGRGAGTPVPAAVDPLGTPRFVRAWTVADLERALTGLADRPVDPARGRQIAEHVRCLECHRFAGAGGSTGPDLTGAGARFSPRDLAVATLEPSETVSDQYQDVEVVTTDEELVVGRLIEDSADGVRLLGLPPDEVEVLVPRAEVDLVRPHPLSRMPSGLVDVLDEDELLDLLAYLLSGG